MKDRATSVSSHPVRHVLPALLPLWLCGVYVACGPAPEQPRDVMQDEQSTELAGGTGGVELEPNTIRGQVRFTNQNPGILRLLDTDTNRFGVVTATSTSPTGFSARLETASQPSLRGFDFEMLVEAGAGGVQGVTYEVLPRWVWNMPTDARLYSFTKAQGVLVRPRSEQPLPTELDFQECLGAIEFQFGTDATCSRFASIGEIYFAGRQLPRHPNRSVVYYAPGGSGEAAATLTYSFGTDVYSNRRYYRQTVSSVVGCDELIRLCIPDPGPSATGAFTGPWDVLGEPSLTQRVIVLSGGPDGNHRYHRKAAPLDARAPVPDESLWWTLPNMVPGDYLTFYGEGYARLGREFTQFRTRSLGPNTVVAGPAVPLTRQINGETRYPFVMRPAYLHGSIRLVDPYVTAHPDAYSSLQALFFEADHDSNGDGIPNRSEYLDANTVRYGTVLRAAGPSPGASATAFPGAFASTTGELSSGYEQLLPYLYSEPHTWRQDYLKLGFWTQGDNFVTRPGEYDPARFRYGYLELRQKKNAPPTPLPPGQRFRVDHEYCFNEVQVEFSTANILFFNPTAAITGGFKGTDWRGLAADYTVTGLASGIPAAVGIADAEAITYARARGSVSFTLPQGSYTLTPGATLVNSDASTNEATFQPLQFTLGCGQRLKLVPPLTVVINPRPTCASGPSQTVTGVVKSHPAEVDRVWYRLNGGPEVTLCEDCGIDPAFSIPVELQACGNTVQVFAFTAGLPEPATGFQQLVWDNPMDGPSCDEAPCVNQPPVARCVNQVVTADAACGGCASVNDGSYDPEGGAVSCVQTPGCSYGLGQNRVTLTCTDSQGESSSCEATVTVHDATPPALTCGEVPALECNAGGAVASYAPSAADNCGGAPSIACTPASGSRFPYGTTGATCTARDAAGNQASCSVPVTVVDTQAPALSLVGEDPLVVSCGRSATAGVVATDTCLGDLSHRVEALGMDPNTPGTYSVSYRVSDLAGNVAQGAPRTVQVVESGTPSLVLNGDSQMTLECGLDLYVDPGAVARDGCGDALEVHRYNSGQDPYGPGPNTHAEGSYPVQYLAWNASGHTVGAIRTVHVEDRLPPSLALRGPAHIVHACGSNWVDPGVEAVDACYGDVSPAVLRTGEVNGWAEGLYTVRYTVTDSGGNNAAPVIRTVEVVDCPW